MDYNLERFITAQNSSYGSYETALREITDGYKSSHWIWYVFPQLRGLGSSYNCRLYGIDDREEAVAYLSHPVLGPRLREITAALLTHSDKSATDILGPIDAVKVRSCMTLFDCISPSDIFAEVLSSFYNGIRCPRSIV